MDFNDLFDEIETMPGPRFIPGVFRPMTFIEN